jgi:hypothetical protein
MGPRYLLQLLFSENSKNANNATSTKVEEKNRHRFEILRMLDIFVACLTKFKANSILLNLINHQFLMTTNPFTG